MTALTATKRGENQRRWQTAAKDRAFASTLSNTVAHVANHEGLDFPRDGDHQFGGSPNNSSNASNKPFPSFPFYSIFKTFRFKTS